MGRKKFTPAITKRFFAEMDRIVGRRSAGKIPASEFAEKVGIHASNLATIRTSPKRAITLEAVALLCHHFGVPPARVLFGTTESGKPLKKDLNDEILARLSRMEEGITKIEKAVKTK